MRTNRATRPRTAKRAAERAAKKAANHWLLKSTLLLPFAVTPALLQAQEAGTEEEATETVIVTGTRATGVDTFTSSSPVQVLSAEDV